MTFLMEFLHRPSFLLFFLRRLATGPGLDRVRSSKTGVDCRQPECAVGATTSRVFSQPSQIEATNCQIRNQVGNWDDCRVGLLGACNFQLLWRWDQNMVKMIQTDWGNERVLELYALHCVNLSCMSRKQGLMKCHICQSEDLTVMDYFM